MSLKTSLFRKLLQSVLTISERECRRDLGLLDCSPSIVKLCVRLCIDGELLTCDELA